MFFSFYLFPRKLKVISQSIEIKIKMMVSMCAIPVFSTDATHTPITTLCLQLLQTYGDNLAGIFAACEPNANGTLESLRNSGLNEQVKFIAFDPSDPMRPCDRNPITLRRLARVQRRRPAIWGRGLFGG